MLQRVELGQLRLDAYREIIGDDAVEAILRAAAPLRGLRVLHINATAFGGGVAEILGTLVPLMADVGLEAEWRIIEGSDAFFEVTKACHNGLQGMDIPFTEEMQATWREYNALNARWFEDEFDVVVVHDPQPLGMLSYTECPRRQWNSGVNWCVRASAPCIGCSHPQFGKMKDFPFYRLGEHQHAVTYREEDRKGSHS